MNQYATLNEGGHACENSTSLGIWWAELGMIRTYKYQWLDSLDIIWINEANPHDYFWNEDWHKYFPDFFLPDYNSYIEVKGYKTDRDVAKWNQFNDKLIIIDKRNINKLNEFQSIEALSELYSFN